MLRIIALLLVLFSGPAYARSIHGSSGTAFNGSPAVTISSGSITGSVVDSRTGDGSNFRPPFFVQVSASGITAIGTSAPYEDLSYSWNFGEGCGDTFIRPTDGASVCSGTDQRGPEAAYVKRTAGTLIVTLTVTGSNGTCNSFGGCNTVAPYVVTKSWVVGAFPANDFYVKKQGACTTSCAGSQADPFISIAQVNANIAGNRAYHFCKGDIFNGAVRLEINPGAATSSLRFDDGFPGCVGSNPKIDVTSGTEAALLVSNGGGSSPAALNDIVFSNIDFARSPGVTASGNGTVSITLGNLSADFKNIYLDNVNIEMTADPSVAAQVFGMPAYTDTHTYTVSNFGLWKVTVSSPTNLTNTDIGEGGSAQNWHFRVGGSVSGSGTSTSLSQHIYPDIKTHGLYQWVTCGPTGTGVGKRSYCFNGNWDGLFGDNTDHQIAQYITYAENFCQYTTLCIDLGNRTNNTVSTDSTAQFQYVVIMGNAMVGMAGPEQFGCGLSVTFRDNRSWGTIGVGNGSGFFGPPNNQIAGYLQGANLLSKLYRNKIYMPGSGVDTGNIFDFSGGTWSALQVVIYNTVVDARASSQIIGVPWSDMLSSGSKIDFNTYSSIPVDTTSWFDGATAKTFAQWQAAGSTPSRWDASGTNLAGVTPSGWTLPVTQWSHMN